MAFEVRLCKSDFARFAQREKSTCPPTSIPAPIAAVIKTTSVGARLISMCMNAAIAASVIAMPAQAAMARAIVPIARAKIAKRMAGFRSRERLAFQTQNKVLKIFLERDTNQKQNHGQTVVERF